MGHRPKDKFLDPVQTFCLHDAAAYIEEQARQGDLDRADSFAGITTDAETLWPCPGLKTVQERGDNQANSPAINMAEGMSSHLLIGWTDVGTGSTTNAAQCIFKAGVSAHLTAPIIDEDNMHLFVRRSRAGDKRCIASQLLGRGTASKQAQLRHGLGKRADQFIIASHND